MHVLNYIKYSYHNFLSSHNNLKIDIFILINSIRLSKVVLFHIIQKIISVAKHFHVLQYSVPTP